jgi:hypothetical protein
VRERDDPFATIGDDERPQQFGIDRIADTGQVKTSAGGEDPPVGGEPDEEDNPSDRSAGAWSAVARSRSRGDRKAGGGDFVDELTGEAVVDDEGAVEPLPGLGDDVFVEPLARGLVQRPD